MTLSAQLDEFRLSVLLDLRHPLAYLALPAAIDFARSEPLDINWLPLSTPPLNAPSAPGADDDRGTRHKRFRADAIAREIEAYAASRRLVLREYYRDGDADASNLGWLWVRDHHPDRLESFLSELFRAYWAVELDPSQPDQVGRLVASHDADPSGFLEWCADDGPQAATLLDEELRGRGLFGVPAYVVEEEVFYGRQHLPMIRWILGGRSGPVPI